MPIKVNAAKTPADFIVVNAAKTQADFVKVNAVKELSYQRSDPQEFTYDAIYSQTYDGTVANNSSNRDVLAYEGHSSIHGDESSLFGFDFAQIQADLAIRPNIISVTLRLSQRWSFDGGGKTFHVAEHNFATKPASGLVFGATLATPFMTRGQILTSVLPNSFAERLRDNVMKGLGLKNTITDWGYCAGMFTTNVLVASPTAGQIEPSGAGEIPRLIINADF